MQCGDPVGDALICRCDVEQGTTWSHSLFKPHCQKSERRGLLTSRFIQLSAAFASFREVRASSKCSPACESESPAQNVASQGL